MKILIFVIKLIHIQIKVCKLKFELNLSLQTKFIKVTQVLFV